MLRILFSARTKYIVRKFGKIYMSYFIIFFYRVAEYQLESVPCTFTCIHESSIRQFVWTNQFPLRAVWLENFAVLSAARSWSHRVTSLLPNCVSQLLFENFSRKHDFEILKHYLLCLGKLLENFPKIFYYIFNQIPFFNFDIDQLKSFRISIYKSFQYHLHFANK